ncbi:uncharacterized protein C8A04DRAFT_30467 [Dichotomopilus funicola]|uniref:Uncharacterized protein n=1 Tax=Dichotomopilus funicola TaxID=1934379 RepID=A0AAN6V0M1_9PEZI|nr:hypothetical protein C8A04DRAFT_30467 [Dichotomopilus funicola]
MSADTGNRVLFLVATPLRQSFDWILCKFHAMTPSTAPQITWDSPLDTPLSLPKITNHLCFARHYAVGVMDRGHWEDPDLTLLEKFSQAHFWEHRGPTCDPNLGGTREEQDVRSIEAVEFLW